MIMTIACGIVVGFILLALIFAAILVIAAAVSKRDTLRTMKRYDFEEEDDYDEYE